MKEWKQEGTHQEGSKSSVGTRDLYEQNNGLWFSDEDYGFYRYVTVDCNVP